MKYVYIQLYSSNRDHPTNVRKIDNLQGIHVPTYSRTLKKQTAIPVS